MSFPSVSAPLFVPAVPFDRLNSGLIFLRWVGDPIPQPGALPIHWIWSQQVLSHLCWVFQLMSSMLGPGNLLGSWHLGHSSGYHQFLLPHCYTPLQIPDPLYFSPISSISEPVPLFPSPSSLPPRFLSLSLYLPRLRRYYHFLWLFLIYWLPHVNLQTDTSLTNCKLANILGPLYLCVVP